MTAVLFRSADVDISADGRNIEGCAFQWDRPSLVSDDGKVRYREAFGRGSVARTLSQRSHRPLFVRHEHLAGSVGETTFSPSADGLMFRARLYDGTLPTAALERVHSGELAAVSIGFRPIAKTKRVDQLGEITLRTEISLEELSLATVDQAQHEGALVLSVRTDPGTPRLDALRRRRAMLLVPR